MKYEAVFGDQSLFDKATRKNTVAIYKISENLTVEIDKYEELFAFLQQQPLCDRPDIAMRRIIQEPKRWTVEDQKTGRLPDVGCMVMVTSVDECASVAAINNDAVCVVFHDGEFTTLHKSGISPLETPEEKAQREEDEFVSLVESKYNHMPNEISFRAGIRAAYRKLKGGE